MQNDSQLPLGPRGLPFIGNAHQFQNKPLSFFRETQRQYPRLATIYVGKQPIVLCFRPEHVRFILVEQARKFAKPNRGRFNLRFLLGDGLLTSDGEFHRQQRRLVQPAFHKHRVESYADIMVQMTQEMLASWQPESQVNISQEMQYLTLRIIAKALFNLDSPAIASKLGQAFDNVINHGRRRLDIWGRLGLALPFSSYGKAMAGKRTLDTFVYNLIAQRRAEGRDTGDVLSMLLAAQDEGHTMTDKQVHDQVLTFIAAGHETAQNTLSWTFYLLSQHAEVREKLLGELQNVLDGQAPTVADLAHLPYLEWVINESWRILPPAWMQGRRALEEVELDGYHFPAGTFFIVSQWVLHHQPDIWGDPETFRPERWNPSNGQKVPQGAYFPFGAGPRICIGMPFAQMETKLLLATILQKYTPRLVPGFSVEPQPRVTLRPKHGMRMILEPTTRKAASSLAVYRDFRRAQ
jgi:cytochrome P450